MADYKRMVSYMYQYENGVKRKNVGFVRVEAKGGICKITLHMQLLGQLDSIFPTYLIQRGDNNIDLIYLGDTILKSQIMDSRLSAEENNIMGSGYALADMGGVLLFLNDNVFFATEWDDKPVVAKEVLEALRPKTNRHSIANEYRNTSNTFRQTLAHTTEQQPEQRVKEELSIPSYKLPGGWKMVERLGMNDHAGEYAENHRVNSINNKNHEINFNKNSDIDLARNNKTDFNKKSFIENIDQERQDKIFKIIEEFSVTAVSPETVVHNHDSDVDQPEDSKEEELHEQTSQEETNQPEDMIEELVMEQTSQPEDIIEESAIEQTNREETIQQRDIKTSGLWQETMEAEAFQREETGNNDKDDFRTSQDLQNRKEVDSSCIGDNINVPDPSVAKHFLENYPRIYPFEDNEIIQCVKIEPKDIGLLPKEVWPLSNNSFLMHGFYCYHHLIFAKMKYRFGCCYILGIPGIYHGREQFMAKMFGFESFKSIRKRELKQGDFGYWYLMLYL